MTARLKSILPFTTAFGLLLLGAVAPGVAEAGCTSCAPPPPCCKPPTPPTPPCNCGHQINIPGVNINVGANVVVNANSQAIAVAGGSGSGTSTVVFGGGGGSGFGLTTSSGLIQGLNVEGDARLIRTPYSATRTRMRMVVIQGTCIDDKEVPHPASQVTPDRDIEEGYDGELFRCIAGTHMQITMADYNGKISFDHGQTINCAKGEAFYHSAGGATACRPQRPARDCNERSLLRRYGAGVKVLKIITTETYTAFREEKVQSTSAATLNMTIDGGVGGIVY
jgi:hypothetical protein